jgi:tetratricopeptide (TPR) repeat protein
MLRLHRLAFLPLVAIALAAPAQQAHSQAEETPAAASAMDDALMYQLLLAEINLNEGEPAAAYALLLDAARKTNDTQLYLRAVEVALQSRAGDAALLAARAWKEAQPESQQANRFVLQILIGLNRIAETLEPLKSELAGVPADQRVLALTTITRQFLRAADKKTAAAIVEQALLRDLKAPETASSAWTAIGRMRLNAGDLAGAEEAAKRVQDLGQPAEGAALLALELMSQQLASGEPLMLQQLKTQSNPGIRMAYARVLMQAQRYADAAAQLHAVIEQQPDYEAAWLIQGALQLQNQQYEEAQTSLQRYLTLVEGKTQAPAATERDLSTAQAYLYLADIAVQRKDDAAAQAWLSHIENAQEIVGAQTRLAGILARQGKLDEARRLIQNLPGRDPDEVRNKLLTEAQLLRDSKQFRVAYELLRSATTDAATDSEVLYEEAMLAEKVGEMGEMERLLRAVIAAKPNYQHAYNALGYSLADRNERLPEAKQLIQKALELAPGDPFISDSLGWVEFRMGNNTEAARILETAYRARPDAEIAAHLGEVLWNLGQKDRAITFWKEGLRLNPENETLGETIKRLQAKW